MYYNFCRPHKTIKTTPAIKAGATKKEWSLEDVVEMMDTYSFKEKENISN